MVVGGGVGRWVVVGGGVGCWVVVGGGALEVGTGTHIGAIPLHCPLDDWQYRDLCPTNSNPVLHVYVAVLPTVEFV